MQIPLLFADLTTYPERYTNIPNIPWPSGTLEQIWLCNVDTVFVISFLTFKIFSVRKWIFFFELSLILFGVHFNVYKVQGFFLSFSVRRVFICSWVHIIELHFLSREWLDIVSSMIFHFNVKLSWVYSK